MGTLCGTREEEGKALEQHVTGFSVEHVELALKQLNPKLMLKLQLDVDVDWDVEPALK